VRYHGVLVDVGGVGVLLLGPSVVGKSECALELVQRGHRLVADDVVELERTEKGEIVGSAPESIRHYMEIRGLGILSIPDLFGADSVADTVRVDLICRLDPGGDTGEYERVGLERPTEALEGVDVVCITLPARPTGSMATVIEVAARDHELRARGINAPAGLDARVRGVMGRS
jgi:HPr kinase/phosphorylase